ncbi:sulfite exporter TauE/SafE family protein [Mucisphaera calidilacus]|uniref:Probable membrane transporter protein n=1 Tax=Mucisphaera calidilacus TaxID=2527982 RepID=A0A518BTG6_9BACT|nr:sulfite exporter TauE/SafE family protein [Mucisphaera calidilacus]QDU70271.1 Sulfite exporter TauE/SafE [Mucisphaera calidilacus]
MIAPWIDPNVVGLLILAVLGLVAGMAGGLLGVGGSLILIPALTFVYGPEQHLYQAAAMIANVAVSVPSALRHRKAGAITPSILRIMLPAAVVAVVVGVILSNLPVFAGRDGGVWLGRLLAVFQVYVIGLNLHRLMHDGRPGGETMPARIGTGRVAGTGTAMGLVAGLLGIGGGAVAVPMQQAVIGVPLRNAIANSAAVICFSAAIGSVVKNATLAQHGVPWWSGLFLALLLAPTAAIGGRIGAGLTHKLPVRQVRIALIVVLAVGAWRMAQL